MGIPISGGHSYDYYAYSGSVARVDKTSKETDIKNCKTHEWIRVEAPAILKRIQQDGTALRNREQADTVFENLQDSRVNNSRRSNPI